MELPVEYRAALRDSYSISVVLGDQGVCPTCLLEFFIRFRCGWDVRPWMVIREMQGVYTLKPIRSANNALSAVAFRVPVIRSADCNGIRRLRHEEVMRVAALYRTGVREFGPEHVPGWSDQPVREQPLPQLQPPPETTVEAAAGENIAAVEPPSVDANRAATEPVVIDPRLEILLGQIGRDFFSEVLGTRRRRKPKKART